MQGGETEGLTEGLQVVVVEDELRQAAKVADGGGEFLDVVVTEIKFTKSCKIKRNKSLTVRRTLLVPCMWILSDFLKL